MGSSAALLRSRHGPAFPPWMELADSPLAVSFPRQRPARKWGNLCPSKGTAAGGTTLGLQRARRGCVMTLTILDPRTGTMVNLSVPEERYAPRTRRWLLRELTASVTTVAMSSGNPPPRRRRAPHRASSRSPPLLAERINAAPSRVSQGPLPAREIAAVVVLVTPHPSLLSMWPLRLTASHAAGA